MTEMQWIKLRIDMFDDEKIKIIQSMPDGDALLVVWIRLIALAGKCNAKGLVLVDDEFPYTDDMLSVIFNKPLATIKLALKTFEQFRMVERTVKGIYITNFEKHQNVGGMDKIREQNRIRKQREREKRNSLLLEKKTGIEQDFDNENEGVTEEIVDMSRDVTNEVMGVSRDMSRDVTEEVTNKSRDVTQQNKNKNKEYIDIYSNEYILSDSTDESDAQMQKKNISYRQIMDDYNMTCIDLPKIQTISEERRRKIRTLMNGMDKDRILADKTVYERLHTIFHYAHDSDFLSGRTGRWNGCSFDWLIEKKNALKVLEGTYVNRKETNKPRDPDNTTAKNKFNRFQQQDYQISDLEEKILSNC